MRSKITPRERAGVLAAATGAPTRKRSAASYREFAEQAMFADWCDLVLRPRGYLYSATMTGINLPPQVAKQAKRKGVRRGQPDFFIYELGTSRLIPHTERSSVVDAVRRAIYPIGLALEFKDPSGKGRASEDQLRWRARLIENGWRHEQPTTFLQAKEITCEHLGLTEHLQHPPRRPTLPTTATGSVASSPSASSSSAVASASSPSPRTTSAPTTRRGR